jgi:adenine-specific DNA-methyltransferase
MKGDQSTGFGLFIQTICSQMDGERKDGFDELHAIFGAQSLRYPKPSNF